MPCGTLGSVKGVPQDILEELGVEILLGNTYHLYLRPGAAQVRQLVQCGDEMYAVGTFTTIMYGSTTYTRTNVFSFSATSPYTLSAWSPSVNGTVNSIAFVGAAIHGTDVALGGAQQRVF